MNLYTESYVMESLEYIRNNITLIDKAELDISDYYIWQIARQHVDIPNTNNIYYKQFISKLIELLCKKYRFLYRDHFKYEIDDSATYFNYNNTTSFNYDAYGYSLNMLLEFDAFQDLVISENKNYNELLNYTNIQSLSNINSINDAVETRLRNNADIDEIKFEILDNEYPLIYDYIPEKLISDLYDYIKNYKI